MSRERKQIIVAMIIQGYLPRLGGAEKQLASLIPLLASRGIEVHVLTRRYPGLCREEIIDGVPVHRLEAPGPKAFASLAFTLNALVLLSTIKPDVIHAHELLSPTTTALLAKRIWQTPVVAKVLRGGVLGDLAKLKRKRFGPSRIAWMRREVDRFIVISNEIDQELNDAGVAIDQRCFIPNGVDTNRFSMVSDEEKQEIRRTLSLPVNVPMAVFAGRFSSEKRIDRLLMSWQIIRRSFPDAILLLMGEGPEEPFLWKIAGPGVVFGGNVFDVRKYLQAADLFVLPSSTEGLSNALLEAMSCGLGIVSTKVGGSTDLIENGQNGFLVEVDDPQGLADAIRQLFADPQLTRTFGNQARNFVVAHNGLESVAGRLADLYVEMRTRGKQ